MQTIQPIKTYNRMNPDPTKDEILEWANQDDNLCWAMGWPILKVENITGKLGKPIEK